MRKQRRNKNIACLYFLLPSFLGVIVFVLAPFADVCRRSLTTAVTGEFRGIDNYKQVFENKAFWLAAGNTAKFVLVCLPLLIGLGLIIACFLSRFTRIHFLKSAFLFPMAVPAATVVLVWKLIFDRQGFLNLFLTRLGEAAYSAGVLQSAPVFDIDYMGTGAAFWVLVFSYIWKNLGYTVVLWLTGILSISTQIREAARVDGAGEFTCFVKIIMPNLKPVLYTITVLSFLNTFKAFREAYLVAGSYPDESMYLLQHLFNNWFTNLDFDKMAAAAVILGFILFAAILLLQKLWDEGE
ncbi:MULTISPECIES: carbohydrate ABC transporter permease [Eisenbergiella]|uniref:carbohydrate ABC transporter permease n=1 Tax=Eisenbergiella TaxID=1432051 RepID=UPI0023F24A83|nr:MULTISPECIES: sugar ABC transporter permease [Eisenbergiella]MCI6707739.1 sugar ABC transporter permease [Eisenbergiella massiliensis]MDY5527549.1 sugar ABC transporter permease [Eisenbergiella porci]